MQAQGTSVNLTALRRLWGQWTNVVERYARRLPRRGWIDPRSYRLLHQDLLAACRALADQNTNGQAVFFEDLCYLAEPWMTLWVLQQTDREILLDLLHRCRAAHHKMGGRRFSRLMRPLFWIVGLTICAVSAGIAVWLIQPQWMPIADWLDDQWRMMMFGAKRLDNWQWLLVIGALGIAAAMFAVSRTASRR